MKPEAPWTRGQPHVAGTYRQHLSGAPQSGTSTRHRGAEQGQGFLEYGLLLALMALVAVLALTLFGSQISTIVNLFAK